MKKHCKLLLVTIIMILFVTGCGNDDMNTEEYSKEIESLTNRVISLESANQKLDEKINNSQKEIEQIKSDLSNLIDQYNSLKNDIDGKSKQITLVSEKDFINLKDKIQNLEKDFKSFKNINTNKNSTYIVTFSSENRTLYYMNNNLNLSNATVAATVSHGDLSIIVQNGKKYSDYFLMGNLPIKYTPLSSEPTELLIGWYTEPDGKGTKITNSTIIDLNSNITLYPYFKEAITLNYICLNQDACTSGKIFTQKGSTLNEIQICTEDDYKLEGFYKESTKKEKYNSSKEIVNGETVYIDCVSK